MQVMKNVRDGDVAGLAVLFERYHVILFRYFVRLSGKRDASEDMVQEVFFRMLKYRHTYRGDGEFLPWMYHIARNVNVDLGKRWNRESPFDADRDDHPDNTPMAHESMERSEETALLQMALSQLPPEKREVLVLSRYQELHYATIAEILGCSIDAVKVRVHRAMIELRKMYLQLAGEKSL